MLSATDPTGRQTLSAIIGPHNWSSYMQAEEMVLNAEDGLTAVVDQVDVDNGIFAGWSEYVINFNRLVDDSKSGCTANPTDPACQLLFGKRGSNAIGFTQYRDLMSALNAVSDHDLGDCWGSSSGVLQFVMDRLGSGDVLMNSHVVDAYREVRGRAVFGLTQEGLTALGSLALDDMAWSVVHESLHVMGGPSGNWATDGGTDLVEEQINDATGAILGRAPYFPQADCPVGQMCVR